MIERIFDIALRTMFVLTACTGIWHYVSFVTPRAVGYAVPVRDGSEFRVVKKMTTKIGETFKSFSSATEIKPFDGFADDSSTSQYQFPSASLRSG